MAQEQTTRQGGGAATTTRRGRRGGGPGASGEARRGRDTILDEIDDVLESNAEDFVRAYVQKGGQ